MPPAKYHTAQALSELQDIIWKSVERGEVNDYEPTGIQEEIVTAFGCGNYEIILCLQPNDVGKTTAGAQILKNIIWPHDPKWFSWWDGYSIFRDRKFKLRRFRITGQHTNLAETGPIQTEIKRWWPRDHYSWIKAGLHFPSQCTCDTGWTGDALSYNQSREEYEGLKIDVLWSDEPPNPDLLGAMTSRFVDKMLWVITATPIKCAAFLDVIQDMEDSGTKVKRLTATAWDNSVTKGKPNHLGTKQGLRTDEEINSKIARCPIDERPARIYGEANTKAGKIYKTFNRDVHVRYFDLTDPRVSTWNCFMAMDPHPKYYPFIQWWAVTPDEKFVCYNEWPTFDMFNAYYDERRRELINPYQPEDLAAFMKILDGRQYGLNVHERFMDPRFAAATRGEGGKTEGIVGYFIPHGIDFTLPPFESIDTQRQRIQDLMEYDIQTPVCELNEPQMFWMPHCRNSIRMMERHVWDEEKEIETERYKEGPDCTRIFLSGWAERGYQRPKPRKSNEWTQPQGELDNVFHNMPTIAIG